MPRAAVGARPAAPPASESIAGGAAAQTSAAAPATRRRAVEKSLPCTSPCSWAGTLHLSFRETPSIDFDINVLSGVTGGAGMTLPIDLKKVVADALNNARTPRFLCVMFRPGKHLLR